MRTRGIGLGVGLGLLLALALTGCGGGGGGDDDGVATAGGASSASASASASSGSGGDGMKFAQCMRENGLPDWPDPEPQTGGGARINAPGGADPEKVRAATEKCKKYMPNGGEPPKADAAQIEQMRKFAKCMRENGVPEFPDPKGDSGRIAIGSESGIDPNSAAFKAAQEKCAQYMAAGPSGGVG